MPGFDDELMQALGGGGGPSFDDELNAALSGGGARGANHPAFLDYAPPQPVAEPDWSDWLGDRAHEFGKAGEGLVRGLNQSLYQGGSDEVAAGGRAALGENFGAALKDEQAANDRAWNETPLTYGAGRALGFVPGMLRAPATALGRVAWGAGQSALNGFLGDDGDLGDRSQAAARDAALGLLTAGAGEGLSSLAAPTQTAGIALRRANAGGTASQLNQIRQAKGFDQMTGGINDDFAELGLADSWKPQTAADVYRKIGPKQPNGEYPPGILKSAGELEGGAMDAAGAAGVRGNWDNVQNAIESAADARMGRAPMASEPTMREVADTYRIARNELPQAPSGPMEVQGRVVPLGGDMPALPPFSGYEPPVPAGVVPSRAATPRELHSQKMEFEGNVYEPNSLRPPDETARSNAYGTAASGVRGELEDTMQSAGPELYGQFKQGRDTFQRAMPFAEMAGTRAAANEAASGFRNPLNYAGAAAGASLGGLAGGIPGMIGGAAMGGMANHIGRNYGQDLAGLGARAFGNAFEGTGGVMQAAGRMGGAIANTAGQGLGEQDAYTGFSAADQGRGYLLPQAALELMRQPGALGKWEREFWDAANSEDSHAIATLITRLSQTDQDFQRQIMPQLQQLTAEGF